MDFLRWLVRIILLPILFPIYFLLALIKEFFSYLFSSFGNFVAGILIAPLFLLMFGVKIFFNLLSQYFTFDFEFGDFMDEYGGWKYHEQKQRAEAERRAEIKREIGETTCAWCGKTLHGHYHYPRFGGGDKPGRRYCSTKCLREAGY